MKLNVTYQVNEFLLRSAKPNIAGGAGKSSSMHRQPETRQTDGFRPKQCGRKGGRHIYTTATTAAEEKRNAIRIKKATTEKERRGEIPNK